MNVVFSLIQNSHHVEVEIYDDDSEIVLTFKEVKRKGMKDMKNHVKLFGEKGGADGGRS